MSHVTRRTVIEIIAASKALIGAGFSFSAQAADKRRRFLETEPGPYHPADPIPEASDLTTLHAGGPSAKGEIIFVGGKVLNPQGDPIAGATVAIWQTDDDGRYRHPKAPDQDKLDPNFLYFASVKTSAQGDYQFKTLAPRPYTYQGLRRARHIHFEVRHPDYGRMTSEMYFAGKDEDRRRKQDKVWKSRDPELREGLITASLPAGDPARREFDFPDDAPAFRFDLQFS